MEQQLPARLRERQVTEFIEHNEFLRQRPTIRPVARGVIVMLGEEIAQLDTRLDTINADILAQHKANPVSVALAKIPGVGPITALTLVSEIDTSPFQSGRHLAAWIGLTPKGHCHGNWRSTVLWDRMVG
jgi:transposase